MRFLEDMWWIALPGTGPFSYRGLSQWRASSWSWASTSPPVSAGAATIEFTKYSIIRAMVKVIDVRVDAKVSGESIRASLILQCRLIPVFLHYYDSMSSRAMCLIKYTEAPLPGYEFHVHLDDPLAARYRDSNILEMNLVILRQSGKDRVISYIRRDSW